MTRIEVLGPGCANCKVLYEHTERAAKELGLECEIEKITDLNVIMGYRRHVHARAGGRRRGQVLRTRALGGTVEGDAVRSDRMNLQAATPAVRTT